MHRVGTSVNVAGGGSSAAQVKHSLELIINDLALPFFSCLSSTAHPPCGDEIIITQYNIHRAPPLLYCHNMLVMRLLNYIFTTSTT